MDSQNKQTICRFMYAVILLTASIPLACAYIMDGGENAAWITRIEEVAAGIRQGRLLLFPSIDAVAGAESHALNSNFWFFLPALIRIGSGDMVKAYRIFYLLVNFFTLYGLVKMFNRLFDDKLTALFGVMFSMTCPYRIWLCYDQGDMGKMVAWMLIPFFMWGMTGLLVSGIRWQEITVSSLALAGIGYADGIMLMITVGCAIFYLFYAKKIIGILPVLAGILLYMPGFLYMMRYLLRGGMDTWNLPIQSIMEKGYTLGQFFSTYVYPTGHPGLGLGLFGALAALIWLCFMENGQGVMRKYGYYVIISLLFLFMSLSCFPWDFVQRVGGVFLRLVSLIDSPNVFFGYAAMFVCVPAAYGVECLCRQERKFVRIGIPLMILIASIGGAVYLCNNLTFMRHPLVWEVGL